MGATQRLRLGADLVEFDARFAGVIHHVRFPVSAVLGIYARETGEGMVFSEQDLGPEPPSRPTPADEGTPRRPASSRSCTVREKESACKPGSVEGNHSSGIRVTANL